MATNGHHHKMEQQQQYASEGRTYTSSQQQEESVRQMEEIRHTNATLDVGQSDSFRAQTEQAAIRIVTPFYKKDDKPGAEMRIGSNAADLSAKFAQAEGADYKAERTAEHFRMQIIEPKVVSHAHIPAHATRDYARRHLVDDFPSLHGKRSFIDLEAMEQRKLRQQRILPEAGDRDRDLEKYLKNRDDDKQWKTPWPAQKPDDDSLREMDRLRQNIDHLQKASMRRSKSLDELRPLKPARVEPPQPARILPRREQSSTARARPAIGATATTKIQPTLPNHADEQQFEFYRRRTRHTGHRKHWMDANGCEGEAEEESWSLSEAEGTDSSDTTLTPPHLCCSTQLPVPALLIQPRHHKRHVNGTNAKRFDASPRVKPQPRERRLEPTRAHKPVQAERDAPTEHWVRNFLLVEREHGADICEWRSTGTMHTGGSHSSAMPSPPQRIAYGPVHQTQQQPKSILRQHQHQYTVEQQGEQPGMYWEDRGEIGISGADEELYEQMQRNLALQRQPSPRPSAYPVAPFNGPFFRLHELSPDGRSARPVQQQQQLYQPNQQFSAVPPPPPPPPPPGWSMREAQEELQQQQHLSEEPTEDAIVISWPPETAQKPRVEVPPPRNVKDPERMEEFLRQERLQEEAERQKQEKEAALWEKQMRAVHIQNELLAHLPSKRQQMGGGSLQPSPAETYGGGATSSAENGGPPGTSVSQQMSPPQRAIRVYEARPISSSAAAPITSPDSDFVSGEPSPQQQTWRRTYLVDPFAEERIDERNEILTSEERLAREHFQIDLLARRDRFIERPEPTIQVNRLGKRWQPPPEKPYRWPSPAPQRYSPITVQTATNGHTAVAAQNGGASPRVDLVEAAEHKWTPVLREVPYPVETKAFEPLEPEEPIRGSGVGPLDAPAQRQTHGLVRPSPDGSHRPRTEFGGARHAPAGGFVPHAPNVRKVPASGGGNRRSSAQERELQQPSQKVRQREQHSEMSSPVEKTHHRGNNGASSRARGARVAASEAPPESDYGTGEGEYYDGASVDAEYEFEQPPLPRHSSTVVTVGPLPRVDVRRRVRTIEVHAERSKSAAPERSRGRSPSAQRSAEHFQRLTAPSPAPASYERARRYVPPALPPAYKARPIPKVERQQDQSVQKEREMLESRSSAHESRHSGYVTDSSWQFNTSFSPRSLVLVNGGEAANEQQQQLLLKVRTSASSGVGSSSLGPSPQLQNGHKERAVVKVETPAPLVRRKEVVEVRREVVKAPAVKHTVHRIEEKKRTEEVERRVLRKERRHKSRRMHRSHHSSSAAAGGGHHEYHYGSWGGGGGGGGFRSSSAQRGYTNGFGHGHGVEHQLPITYEGTRSARSAFDSSAASDHRFGGFRNGYGGGGMAHARYGSLSDSLRRGDLKYVPNGELRVNGDGKVKHHRVHKAHSTRDVFYRGDGGADQHHYSSFQRGGPPPPEPFVEFPPTLDRRSDWSGGPEPPPHRRHFDEFGAGAPRGITKARSYADWDEGRAAFGNRYDDDMARLEHEFRDARLMRIPNGKMDEKEHHHREIPGGYESYSRETKAHSSAQKLNGNSAAPAAEVQ